MSSSSPIKLKIPAQDLTEFSAFDLDAAAANNWADMLPVADHRRLAHQLQQTISDLNRVDMAPETRFEIMEQLRPSLLLNLGSLSRRYLGQPLVMPDEPRQMAQLANQLMGLGATAYTIAAVHTMQRRETIRGLNPARLLCECLQRALSLAGERILQTFQLYRPIGVHRWLELHQLYSLAEAQKLSRLSIEDPLAGATSVTTTYLQILLLGCSKPNQLRQSDMSGIYRALGEWAQLASLREPHEGRGLFLVDLSLDRPAIYNALAGESAAINCRYIDTEPLIGHLQSLQVSTRKQVLDIDSDTSLPINMLGHLITALGSMSLRNFNRQIVDRPLWVALGLSSAHYHLAGEVQFDHLIHGDNYIPPPAERLPSNLFLQREHGDLWQRANPEEDFVREKTESEEEEREAHQINVDRATLEALEPELADRQQNDIGPLRYPVHQLQMVDASPGGYCLELPADLGDDVRAGDISCIREQLEGDWMLAVIRWVHSLDSSGTLIGLELLSPEATPYGAIIQQKTGGQTDPLRVLLLPEIKLVGQPQTLITPRAAFKERQKITLIKAGESYLVQLINLLGATGSYAQFDFRYIQQPGDLATEHGIGELETVYSSVWNDI